MQYQPKEIIIDSIKLFIGSNVCLVATYMLQDNLKDH